MFGRGRHVLNKDSILLAIPGVDLYLKMKTRWVLITILS